MYDREIVTIDRKSRMYDQERSTIDRQRRRPLDNQHHRSRMAGARRSIRKSHQNLSLPRHEPATTICIHSLVSGENGGGIVGRFWCEEGNIEANIINYGWV